MRERKVVKLRVDMYEDTKFKMIDRMEERDLIHYIWTRLITLAGKVNLGGDLFLSKNIPYTIETLAIEFNREVPQVELAIKAFIKLEMVELTEDNIYRVKNFAKHQNIKIEEKTKKEDKIETSSKAPEDKALDNKAQNKDQLKENYEAAIDLNNKVIALNNSTGNESTKNDENLNSISKVKNFSGNNSAINIDFSKDAITNNVVNINDVNKINSNDQTVNNSETETKEIQVETSLHNVPEDVEKTKNENKRKRKSNKAINEINADEDEDEEVIELQGGERTLGKGERIVSSFSF